MLAASVRLGRDDGRMNSGRMSPGLLAQQRAGAWGPVPGASRGVACALLPSRRSGAIRREEFIEGLLFAWHRATCWGASRGESGQKSLPLFSLQFAAE